MPNQTGEVDFDEFSAVMADVGDVGAGGGNVEGGGAGLSRLMQSLRKDHQEHHYGKRGLSLATEVGFERSQCVFVWPTRSAWEGYDVVQ